VEKGVAGVLARHLAVYARLAALNGIPEAEAESRAAQEALDGRLFSEEDYRRFLTENLALMARALDRLARSMEGDPFGAREQLDTLSRLAEGGATAVDLAAAHANVLDALDETLTWQQLAQGDPAAILQTARWQRDLFVRAGRLAALPEAEAVVDAARSFVRGYREERLGAADYPAFLRDLFDALRRVAGALEPSLPGLTRSEQAVEAAVAGGDLAAMQKAHRGFLAQLQTLDSGL
jgi:primosomal protein N''